MACKNLVQCLVSRSRLFRELKQTRTHDTNVGGKKKYFFVTSYFAKHIFTLVTVYVSLSLKLRWPQRLPLNETKDVSSWNVGRVLKTAWKWSSWSLIWEQDGTNVSFISHIRVRFLSCVISLIVGALHSVHSMTLTIITNDNISAVIYLLLNLSHYIFLYKVTPHKHWAIFSCQFPSTSKLKDFPSLYQQLLQAINTLSRLLHDQWAHSRVNSTSVFIVWKIVSSFPKLGLEKWKLIEISKGKVY